MTKAIHDFDEDVLAILKSLRVGYWLISLARVNVKKNDVAHYFDHVSSVVRQTQVIADQVSVGFTSAELFRVKRIAAMGALLHDIACHVDRDEHHVIGANWVRNLIKWKSKLKVYNLDISEANDVAACILEHRASWPHPRTSLVSEIVAAADRGPMEITECLRRSYLYGRFYKRLDVSGALTHACDHIADKYGDNGYVYKNLPRLCLLATVNIDLLRTQAMDKNLGRLIITEHREKWEKYYQEVRHASE